MAVWIFMKKRRNDSSLVPLAIVIAAAVLRIAIMGALSGREQAAVDDVTAEGIAYLEALEQKDPAAVMQVRQQIYDAKIDAQRDQLGAQLNNGSTDPFSLFQNYVLMGDSRAVGFWYHNYLEKGRTFCDGGHTIRKLEEYMDTVVSMEPTAVYLTYGLNDCSSGYWDSIDAWITQYMQLVQELKQRLPDATVVVSSIPQVNSDAYAKSTRWKGRDDWNVALKKACKDNGVTYAECSQILVDHPNYLDPVDGHHFRKEFYPYWASCLVAAMLMEGAA